MKIHYIINGRLPTEKANGYQISQMCQAFVENGADVVLLRPRRALDPKHLRFKNNFKEFYNLRFELETVDVWSFDFQKFFHDLNPFFDRFQFVTNILHTFTFVWGLAQYFKKQNMNDLIYLRDINILGWLWFFLKAKQRDNMMLELHYLPEAQVKRKRYARILSKAKAVVAITEKMKVDLIELGVAKEKIWVEHDGVDLSTFDKSLSISDARKIFGYPQDHKIVGYVGNFHTNGLEKGVDDLIRAAKFVLAKQPQVQFYFVGGPLDRVPKYEALISELGLQRANFKFFDRRPVFQVPASMAACDVLVIPLPWSPYFAYYMSPMKLFEYMASGRPIVATAIESLQEILEDGETALLAKADDQGDLAEKILNILDDRPLAELVASGASAKVQVHSWKLRAERILGFVGGQVSV
jgi:glycosyltransferase involved in cell wall biosynthesis